jgi:hypothetical protein
VTFKKTRAELALRRLPHHSYFTEIYTRKYRILPTYLSIASWRKALFVYCLVAKSTFQSPPPGIPPWTRIFTISLVILSISVQFTWKALVCCVAVAKVCYKLTNILPFHQERGECIHSTKDKYTGTVGPVSKGLACINSTQTPRPARGAMRC